MTPQYYPYHHGESSSLMKAKEQEGSHASHIAHTSSCCWDPDFNSEFYASTETHSNTTRPQLACFLQGSDNPHTPGVCLDPLLILNPATPPPLHRTLARCGPEREEMCDEEWSCVRPRTEEQLMRISVRTPPWMGEHTFVVVWRGPQEEIFDQSERLGKHTRTAPPFSHPILSHGSDSILYFARDALNSC